LSIDQIRLPGHPFLIGDSDVLVKDLKPLTAAVE
jgi:hypothetical protein